MDLEMRRVECSGCKEVHKNALTGEGPFGALPANLKFIHWSLCIRKQNRKIGTRSVHVGSLCKVSQDTPNYNCTSLRIMTMSNTHDRNFAVYGQTQANCNVFFL